MYPFQLLPGARGGAERVLTDSEGAVGRSSTSTWVLWCRDLCRLVSLFHIRIRAWFAFVEKKSLETTLGRTISNLRINFRRETSFGEVSGVPQSCCQEEAQCQPDQVLWDRDNPTIVQVRLLVPVVTKLYLSKVHICNIRITEHITYVHICSDWMHSSSWSRCRPPAAHSRHCRRTLRFPGLALSPMSFCIL